MKGRSSKSSSGVRFLTRLLLLGLTALCVFLIVALFLPSKVRVERSLSVEAAPDCLFEQINTVRNWEKWSPWHKLDPKMKLTYEGPGSGEGAKYTWESTQKNVGSGSLIITQSATNQSVQTAMDFRKQGQATASFELVPEGQATKVVWSMESNLGKNPIARYFGLFIRRVVGPQFETGLQNLKELCEGKSK